MFFCMWRCVLFVSLYFRNDTQVAFYGCFVCIANTNVILHTPISRRGAAASEQVSLILIFYKNQSTASLFLLYPTKQFTFRGNPFDCARCINILFYSGIPLSRSAQLLMYVYFLTFSPGGERRAAARPAQQAVFVTRGCFTKLHLIL